MLILILILAPRPFRRGPLKGWAKGEGHPGRGGGRSEGGALAVMGYDALKRWQQSSNYLMRKKGELSIC